MAIDFKTALTISGVTVQPGYPALAGLTAGQVLRASNGTTVAFAALVAADLPSNVAYKDSDNQFSVGQGVRAALGATASGLYVPWISGDIVASLRAGSGNSSNNMPAVSGESYSSSGILGISSTGVPIDSRRTSALTNSTGTTLNISHRSSGTIAPNFGAALRWQLQSSTTADQDAASIVAAWSDQTHATRTAYLAFNLVKDSAALAEKMRLTAAGQLLGRSTDDTQAASAYFPWITGDTLAAVVVGAGGTHSTGGLTARAGTGLAVYAAATTGTPLYGERLSSTNTNSSGDLLVLKHTAATPANVLAGYGAALSFQLSSTTTAGRVAGKVISFWIDPADASYQSGMAFYTATGAALAERMRITNTGQLIIRGTVATNASSLYLPTVAGDTLPMLYVGGQSSDALQVGIQAYSLTKEAIIGTSYNSVGVLGQMNGAFATGVIAAYDNDTASNTIPTVAIFRHRSTATAVANFGVQLAFQGKSSTSNDQDMAYLTTYWIDPTHATRTSILTFSTVYSGLAPSAKMYLTGYGYLGLNSSVPAGDLHINVRNQEATNGGLTVGGVTGTYAPSIVLRRSAGTFSTPTDLANSAEVGRIGFHVYSSSAWAEGAYIRGINVTGGEARVDLAFNQDTGTSFVEVMRMVQGKVGIGETAPATQLDVVRDRASQLRLASGAGTGTTLMAYSDGTTESLYMMVNRKYESSAFSRIDTGQPSWTLSMGSQDADSFKIYRETAAGVNQTLLQLGSTGVLETTLGGTIRATEGTYAAPASGQGLEIASTGSTGYVQSYNRSTSTWRALQLNGSTITFGGAATLGSFNSSGDLTATRYFNPGNQTTYYMGVWSGSGIFVYNHLLVNGAVFPGNQGSYYLQYTSSPAGLQVVGNLSCAHDIFPGNNNGVGATAQASYYLRGETNSGGIRTNGALLATGVVSAGAYLQASGALGTNHLVALCSSGLYTLVFSGLGGYSFTAGGLGYNYGNINGSASGQITGSNGGGFIRWGNDGQIHIASMNTSGTVGIVFYAGLNNVGIGTPQGTNNRLFTKGIDSTSSNNAFLCQNSGGSNLMYVRNDGQVWANQAWTISDLRYKENVVSLPYGLSHILQLRPIFFDYIDGLKQQLGFGAQDVREVIPELVTEEAHNEDYAENAGRLAVQSTGLIPILVKAIQEQQQLLTAQAAQIAALIARFDEQGAS